jgi:hypothetical protein
VVENRAISRMIFPNQTNPTLALFSLRSSEISTLYSPNSLSFVRFNQQGESDCAMDHLWQKKKGNN